MRQNYIINWSQIGFCCAILLLTGCGFSPMYGNRNGDANDDVAAKLSNIIISNIPDRNGQFLRNLLIDRMYSNGRPNAPEARLDVTIAMVEEDLGIQRDATSSYRNLDMTARYILLDNAGREILRGVAHSVVGYSKPQAQYAVLTARDNARERALNEVGEQIVNRLGLHFAEGTAAKP